jgi:hypothetical protein
MWISARQKRDVSRFGSPFRTPARGACRSPVPAWLPASALAAALSVIAARAAAQTSPYCRKTLARAEGDAALLAWPRVVVEGIRFPDSGRVDIGATVGDNIQGRVAMSLSPLDIYRGARLTRAAEADCAQHETSERLRDLFVAGLNPQTIEALEAQAAYLESRRTEWRALMGLAEDRLRAGLIMLTDLHDLRRFVSALERKLEAVKAQAEQLQAVLPEGQPELAATPAGLEALAKDYVQHSLELDEELGHLRSLDPWGIKLSAGAIPMPGQPADWYGFVEIGYALGGFGRNAHETEYLAARRAELRQASYALPARVRELTRLIAAEIAGATRQRDVVDGQLRTIEATRTLLETADVPQAEHTRAMLRAEGVLLESERVYFQSLIDALTRVRKHSESS